MSLFFLDRGFGSLGAVVLGSIGAIITVPIAVAGSALLCGLVSGVLPRTARRKASI
jgi:hypothetical protein